MGSWMRCGLLGPLVVDAASEVPPDRRERALAEAGVPTTLARAVCANTTPMPAAPALLPKLRAPRLRPRAQCFGVMMASPEQVRMEGRFAAANGE
jgi:hypothetical protein